MNYPMNSSAFKLYKNVQNDVDFYVKDIDRKSVSMNGSLPILHISDRLSKVMIYSKQLTEVNATKGQYRLTIPANDLLDFGSGQYSYVIVVQAPNGIQTMLFTDRDRSATGDIELLDGPFPAVVPSLEIDGSAFLPTGTNELTSGSYPGSSMNGDPIGIHTLVAYLNQFQGTIILQGSLTEQISSLDREWFDVGEISVPKRSSKTVAGVFDANLRWVRIKIRASGPIGSVKKFMLRS